MDGGNIATTVDEWQKSWTVNISDRIQGRDALHGMDRVFGTAHLHGDGQLSWLMFTSHRQKFVCGFCIYSFLREKPAL